MSRYLLDVNFFQTIFDMIILNPTQLALESYARKREKNSPVSGLREEKWAK